jgi:hypothetical protein
MAMPPSKLELSTLARCVADELRKANASVSQDGNAIMNFVECEIEVGFTVEIETGGKINIWAVELGATGNQATSNTVRIKYQALPGVSMQAAQNVR